MLLNERSSDYLQTLLLMPELADDERHRLKALSSRQSKQMILSIGIVVIAFATPLLLQRESAYFMSTMVFLGAFNSGTLWCERRRCEQVLQLLSTLRQQEREQAADSSPGVS